MSELGVKDFVAQSLASHDSGVSLAGLCWSGQPMIFRQRPKQTKLGDNVALIIGRSRYAETRLAGPRAAVSPTVVVTPGQKQRDYSLDVLLYATWPDEQAGGDSFDVLKERVVNVLESMSVPMPNWPDPVMPSVVSTILAVGERVEVQSVDPILTGGRDSRTRFGAVVTARITEILQG